ncbi:MAG: MFS transporter, partial [Rubripirellula sp.]
VTQRLGVGGTLLAAMALLAMGAALRGIDWVPALYFGTLLIGIAIALGNVLLPSIAKRNFATSVGLITSCYSSAMGLGAALAAGVSVPLAIDLKLGWRGALGVWAIPALIALVGWSPQVVQLKRSEQPRSFRTAMKVLGSSRLAWNVALFMGLQSFTFYVVLTWLPTVLIDRGYSAEFSGWMLSLSQATGILGSLAIPVFAGRNNDQRRVVSCLVVLEAIGIVGLLFPSFGWVELWVCLIGFVLGGTFGLALLFIAMRAHDSETATELSGMAQSIGYLVAATGPVLFGSLFDLTGTWTYSLILLLMILVLKLWMGLGAGRPAAVDVSTSIGDPLL